MVQESKTETSKKSKPKNGAKWFKLLGWLLGLGLSAYFPQLTAPFGQTLPFKLFGTLSAIAGFGLVFKLTPALSVGWKIFWTVLPLIVGGVAGGIYKELLQSIGNTTPSEAMVWTEFGLFCLAYFCVFAVIGSAYRNGAAPFIQKFGKLTIPSN